MNKNFTVAVLAGGKSKRFGKQKLFYNFRGKKLIEYSLDLGEKLSEEIFIAGNLDYSNINYNFYVVKDYKPDAGPLSAVISSLNETSKENLILIPGDTPFLSESIYKCLMHHHQENKITVGVFEKKIEPLISIWPKSIKEELIKELEKDVSSVKSIIKNHNYITVDFKKHIKNISPNVFLNINYLEDADLGKLK